MKGPRERRGLSRKKDDETHTVSSSPNPSESKNETGTMQQVSKTTATAKKLLQEHRNTSRNPRSKILQY
eukprot:scaffold5605_cov105-Skeletonema_dohrnii-CCMP3373.AAC.15